MNRMKNNIKKWSETPKEMLKVKLIYDFLIKQQKIKFVTPEN